jgi:hypothetical protein
MTGKPSVDAAGDDTGDARAGVAVAVARGIARFVGVSGDEPRRCVEEVASHTSDA